MSRQRRSKDKGKKKKKNGKKLGETIKRLKQNKGKNRRIDIQKQ